jgi:SAM-dependent methyltransferase
MDYAGRPGITPSLAALISVGLIQKKDRILDVGCANGTDALLLARWGFRHVVGVDPDAAAIGTARARATRARLSKRVTFHHLGAESLGERFKPGTFDVVLHTLVANNLTKEKSKHFREIATALRPDGLLVLHERIGKHADNSRPGRFPPLPAARKYFDLGVGIATHLAEHPANKKGPQFARVVLWLGRPRR